MEPLSDEAILNNSTIAHSIMTFAELYLAYKYAAGKRADIIFLDRNLSTTYLSLISSTSSSGKLWQTNCSILNTQIDGVGIDVNDLKIARQRIINQMLNLPPSRGTCCFRYFIFNFEFVNDFAFILLIFVILLALILNFPLDVLLQT
jgi:hypothetical protein